MIDAAIHMYRGEKALHRVHAGGSAKDLFRRIWQLAVQNRDQASQDRIISFWSVEGDNAFVNELKSMPAGGPGSGAAPQQDPPLSEPPNGQTIYERSSIRSFQDPAVRTRTVNRYIPRPAACGSIASGCSACCSACEGAAVEDSISSDVQVTAPAAPAAVPAKAPEKVPVKK